MMTVFEYLYYRMYNAYAAKNDDPQVRTFLYLSVVFFILLLVFLWYLRGVVEVLSPTRTLPTLSAFFWLPAIGSILLFTYGRFGRRDFAYYEQRFASRAELERTLPVWLLVAFPFVFLLGSIIFSGFLFGGVLLGWTMPSLFGR